MFRAARLRERRSRDGEFMMEVVTTVPRSKNPSLLKDEELYEDLREQGNSKEKAAPSGALRSPPW